MLRLLLILSLLLLAACSDQAASYPQRIMPPDLVLDETGFDEMKKLFLKSCADCHGTLSEGRMERADFFEPAAPDFTADSYRQADPAFLYWRIAEGKMVEPYRSMGSVMPPWEAHFSEEKIWKMIAYLQTRSQH